MYLECSHSKLNHDIETLMMALIAITRNGIIIYIAIYFLQHYPTIIARKGMQIIHFNKFCVPVSTGTSKSDKSLKMPSDSSQRM